MATAGDVVRASSMLQPDHGELNMADTELKVPTGSIPRESTVIQMPPDSHADGLLKDDNKEATVSSQHPDVINQETDALLEGQNQSELLSLAEIRNIIWIKMGPEGLKEVDDGNDHALYKVALEHWEDKNQRFVTMYEKNIKQSMLVRNEIYQLIGFYSVFQGVLLTAVAQSNLLHCNNWWSVFSLSALASFVTVFGVIQKFHSIWQIRKMDRMIMRVRRELVTWLRKLTMLGPKFSFQRDAREHKHYRDKLGFCDKLKFSIIAVIVVLILFSCTFFGRHPSDIVQPRLFLVAR